MLHIVSIISELQEVIIPHFVNYPLLIIKRINFLLFKDIVNIMYKKEHLKLYGVRSVRSVRSVLNIRASMNKGATGKFCQNFPNVMPVTLPQVNPLKILIPIYL